MPQLAPIILLADMALTAAATSEDRIAAYDTIAEALHDLCPDRSAAARAVADALRMADAQQLRFSEILRKPRAEWLSEAQPASAPQSHGPFRHDRIHAHLIYSNDRAANGQAYLPQAEWARIEADASVLIRFHIDFDEYREGRSEDGEQPLSISQFLPVWEAGRAQGWDAQHLQAALRDAEERAGLRHQATC